MSKKKKIAIIGNAGIGKSLAYKLAKNKCGLPIVVESNFICVKQNKGEIKCKTQCGWCEGNN